MRPPGKKLVYSGRLSVRSTMRIFSFTDCTSFVVMRELRLREVLTTDPFVTTDPALLPLDQVVARSDMLILCTPHSTYADADLKGKPVVDVWGFLKNANVVT